VVEGDVFEDHVLLDVCLCMTPLPEATEVAHLVMGFLNSLARYDIREAQLDIS
jgi:hypothetical protein